MQEYRPTYYADRKGPRFNLRKFRHKIVTKEVYAKWKKKTGSTLDFTDFKRIWKYIALELHEGVIGETNGVLLPYGIGELYIGYVQVKSRPIDYNLSRLHNTPIYHENYHSYGKIGKIIYYACGKYSLSSCNLWNFKPITPFKEKSTQAFRDMPERYKHSRQKMYYGYTSNRTVDIPAEESNENS